jgi:hypothetical protein
MKRWWSEVLRALTVTIWLRGKKGTIGMPTAKLTNTIIQAAIDGFEAQKKSIDAQIAELRAMLPGAPEPSADEAPVTRTRHKFSAATRKRMGEAQRLRWAKMKGDASPTAVKTPAKAAKPKGGITDAGRKALSIAMKKRWAAKKAARGQSAPAAKKLASRKAA